MEILKINEINSEIDFYDRVILNNEINKNLAA